MDTCEAGSMVAAQSPDAGNASIPEAVEPPSGDGEGQRKIYTLAVVGGVAANQELRRRLQVRDILGFYRGWDGRKGLIQLARIFQVGIPFSLLEEK